MSNDSRQPARANSQKRRRALRWRRRLRTWLPYAAVPALMMAALFTPGPGPEGEAVRSSPTVEEFTPRAEDVEAIEPVDGLGGRETDEEPPTPTPIESEGDTI